MMSSKLCGGIRLACLRTRAALEFLVATMDSWGKDQAALEPSQLTHWHVVDDEMTPGQCEEISTARLGEARTAVVWVKFSDPSVGRIAISRGRFD